MDKNESKEEIKLLGNKRKLEHDDSEEKELINNNKNNLLKKDENNIFNILDPAKEDITEEKDNVNQTISKEIEVMQCFKCGEKKDVFIFKKGEDIYNYFLSSNLDKKEDIKIMEEKFKNIEFTIDKKICKICLENLIKEDKVDLKLLFYDEKEINPNNNIIKESSTTNNISLNEEVKEKTENNNTNDKKDNNYKDKKTEFQNILNNLEEKGNTNQLNINSNQNQFSQNKIFFTEKTSSNQNQINPNLATYLNQFMQNNNNNIPLNLQNISIMSQNINNIQNKQNISNSPSNINAQNNNNINKNSNFQIPPQILLNNPNLNYNLYNNSMNNRIDQLMYNNALYGNANIFNLGSNISQNQNNNVINNINNLNANLNRSNINNNNLNINTNTNTNNNINRLEQDLEQQIK